METASLTPSRVKGCSPQAGSRHLPQSPISNMHNTLLPVYIARPDKASLRATFSVIGDAIIPSVSSASGSNLSVDSDWSVAGSGLAAVRSFACRRDPKRFLSRRKSKVWCVKFRGATRSWPSPRGRLLFPRATDPARPTEHHWLPPITNH